MTSRFALISTAIGLLAATSALAGDPNAPCAKPEKQHQAMADRCIAVFAPPVRVEALSDHGAGAGEAYDRQGNPLDRHGNIIAVPESRSGPREVFANATR